MSPAPAAGLAGRVALVPGGTGALGQAVALALLGAGARVTVTARAGAAEGLRAAAGPAADRLRAVAADVTDGAAVARLVAEAAGAEGRLDVLVNVVGGFAAGTLLDTDEAAGDRMLDLNLRSAYLCCRAALPPMIAAGGGRIVNVASRSVVPPAGGFIAYTVAKAGVIALTQALAREVRPQGVTVNAVLPSTMDTPANREAMPGADRSGWVQPASVAAAILFLAGAAAAEVTGTLLAV
jgi:NAD(P)-dependent dehydrogenase (short-subunit alcohol dehydrogenase family)